MTSSLILLGVHGNVIALDRATGQQVWCAELKGADFVNVHLDEDRVIAATKGEVFCLDANTGASLWHNQLPGQGRGLITIATASGASDLAPFREKRRQDEAAAAAAAGAASSGA